VGKCLKTVLFGAPNGGRLPDGSDRLYYFLFGHLVAPCRDLGAQNANLGPGLAQIAQPVRMAEICLGKRLKTVLFGAPNGGRLPDGSDRLYTFLCAYILKRPVAIWAPKMRIWGPVWRKLPSLYELRRFAWESL
jgi:hypothetical protein